MSDSNALLSQWEEFKTLVESLESDLIKNASKGNKSAGVRVRKGLRLIKKQATTLVKSSLTNDKNEQ
ncbi:MAG: histone H1 [Rhodospirillaceae bacterium]|jgi:hypothetical protein|nr:histone H1 [Rhodospirillaceae bacterium]